MECEDFVSFPELPQTVDCKLNLSNGINIGWLQSRLDIELHLTIG